jgi:hypothetical protein
MIIINENEHTLQITTPGGTAEYVALLQGLAFALRCMEENSEPCKNARYAIGNLLMEMQPNEHQVKI